VQVGFGGEIETDSLSKDSRERVGDLHYRGGGVLQKKGGKASHLLGGAMGDSRRGVIEASGEKASRRE